MSLALIRATHRNADLRNGDEAVRCAQHAADLTKNADPAVLRILAMALADDGHFQEAVAIARRARSMASASKPLQNRLDEEIRSYESKDPIRE